MAKPPELIQSSDDVWKVFASFSGGRFRFTLRDKAVSLLRNDLGYEEGDIIPWELFRILVFTGDAWLPNPIAGRVETGGDLARPDRAVRLPERDAEKLADHLRGGQFDEDVREALIEEIQATTLGEFITADELAGKQQWIEDTMGLLNSAQSQEPEGEPDQNLTKVTSETSQVRLVHIGRVTLGRKNMGRSERIDDHLGAFQQALDIAIEREVSAVVQTGALFQSRSPSQAIIEQCRTELSRLSSHDIPFYHVYESRELEAKGDHFEELIDDGLMRPLGGQFVSLSGEVTLRGVDADSSDSTQEDLQGKNSSFTICGVGSADATKPDSKLLDTIEANTSDTTEMYLVGGRTDPAWSKRNGSHIIDPGATEHVLSKTTFGEEPIDRGIYEYTIEDGGVSATRHDLQTRPFETIWFDLGREATIETVVNRVDGEDLSEKAVLGLLDGEKDGQSVSRKAVQEYLADRSYCARVYDDRNKVASEVEYEETVSKELDTATLAETSAAYLSELEKAEEQSFTALSEEELVDLYTLYSKVRSVVEASRKSARNELVKRVSAGETVTGSFGSVSSHRRESERLRSEEEILAALEKAGIPDDAAYSPSLDKGNIDELLESSEIAIEKEEVLEVTESKFVKREDLDLETLDDTGN